MKIFLATPEKPVFSGEVTSLLLEAEKGQINILERHARLISLVRPGPITIRHGQTENRFHVGDGVIKVENETVNILCDTAKAQD